MSATDAQRAQLAEPRQVGADTRAPVVIDRLRWWDLDEVQALEDSLFPGEAWTPGQFWSELARVPQSRWYVAARRGGCIVGYAGVHLIGPEVDVQTLAVATGQQGGGIGWSLLAALADHARGGGARVLRLEVRADNRSARSLYDRAGFVVDGRRRDYYGRGQDAVLMSLDLGGVDG